MGRGWVFTVRQFPGVYKMEEKEARLVVVVKIKWSGEIRCLFNSLPVDYVLPRKTWLNWERPSLVRDGHFIARPGRAPRTGNLAAVREGTIISRWNGPGSCHSRSDSDSLSRREVIKYVSWSNRLVPAKIAFIFLRLHRVPSIEAWLLPHMTGPCGKSSGRQLGSLSGPPPSDGNFCKTSPGDGVDSPPDFYRVSLICRLAEKSM